jgi:hypothetical protein
MRYTSDKKNGFTIVELLVYSGVLVVFLYLMTSLFSSILDMQLETQATSAAARDGRFIVSRLSYDIWRATTITIPASLGSVSDTLRLTIDGNTYTYAVQGENLTLTEGGTTSIMNGYDTKVSGLSFRRYGVTDKKHSIRFAFTLTSRTVRTSGPEIRNFQSTVAMR